MTKNPAKADAAESWLDAIDIGTWSWDPAASQVVWDDASHRIYELEPDSFGGTFDAYLDLVHPDDRDEVLRVIGDVAATGGDYSIRHRIVTPGGVVRWIEGQGRITTVGGIPTMGRGIVYALSDRLTLDRERDELTESEGLARADSAAARQRLRFLIELTDAIGGSLNTERVARSFVSMITRELAAACVVDVNVQDPYGHILTCVGDSGGAQNLVTASPVDAPCAASRASMPIDGVTPLPDTIVAMDTEEQARLAAIQGTVYASAFPMFAHGARVGTVLALRDTSWSREARELLEAASRRLAGAFDRAALHADRSKFVSMFQVAATPRDLPTIDGLDIAVHYRPATDLVRLGGDLYDIFQLDKDTWMIGVGDICGKGIIAAGHAELARTALRSAAFATDDPVAALRVLNRTLLAEASRPMLTAALARVQLSDGSAQIDVATAGHPAPLVVSGAGDFRTVNSSGTMLGVTPDARFQSERVRLAPGESIAVYTDGVTESRFGSEFFGVERLGLTLARSWPASAMALVSGVASTLDTWTAGHPTDDVLLLVMRVTEHDGA